MPILKPCILLELEPYLRQWLLHASDGIEPIQFEPRSSEYRFLRLNLEEPRTGQSSDLPTERSVFIVVPRQHGESVIHHTFLSRQRKHQLKEMIRDRCLLDLWTSIHRFKNAGERIDLLCMDWMTSRGIEIDDTNCETLLKQLQRQKQLLKTNKLCLHGKNPISNIRY